MKTQKIMILIGLMLAFLSLTSFKSEIVFNNIITSIEIQEELVVHATFDGKEDYGYNFIVKNKDGDENTITFQEVDEGVIKVFDLNSETLIGSKFKVSYRTILEVTKDVDGYEDESEINTITKLEKL